MQGAFALSAICLKYINHFIIYNLSCFILDNVHSLNPGEHIFIMSTNNFEVSTLNE